MSLVTQAPKPYEPCYCGSGKKYKFCHYQVDSAPVRNKRVVSQQMYVERWSKSSDNFQGQGCYSWMAAQLSRYSPKFILDVGCGDGIGLMALYETRINVAIKTGGKTE